MAKKGATYGQWDEALKILHGMNALTEINMRIATKYNGMYLRDKIKRTIRDQRSEWPKLKPATIARKGSSKILIDKGDLLNAINYQIVDSFTFFVGVPKSAPDKDGEPIVQIAIIMEFGTLDGKIPARSYVGVTIEICRPDLMENWYNAMYATLNGKKYKRPKRRKAG